MRDEPVQIALRNKSYLLHLSVCKDALFQGPLAVHGDGVVRFGIAKDFGTRCGGEVRLAVDLKHPNSPNSLFWNTCISFMV